MTLYISDQQSGYTRMLVDGLYLHRVGLFRMIVLSALQSNNSPSVLRDVNIIVKNQDRPSFTFYAQLPAKVRSESPPPPPLPWAARRFSPMRRSQHPMPAPRNSVSPPSPATNPGCLLRPFVTERSRNATSA